MYAVWDAQGHVPSGRSERREDLSHVHSGKASVSLPPPPHYGLSSISPLLLEAF